MSTPSTDILPPTEIDIENGLVYLSDDQPGITRRRSGGGFSYRSADGAKISDRTELARIRGLAIPPAWTDVWIAPRADAHLQATGRDAAGRKQYRYHEDFLAAREAAKFEHLVAFAEVLPRIRERTAADLRRRGLPREKILAAVVRLLETTLIRIGNETYARTNRSYGLTTLRNRHVVVAGEAMRFRFTGKSGKSWRLKVADRRLARVIRSCQHLPGQRLFQYLDEEGQPHVIESADVNAYLREITGRNVTAKDFRTWAGTVLAALALHEFGPADSPTKAKRAVSSAVKAVASKLGNTPAVCRRSYIHPIVLDVFESGRPTLLAAMEEIAADEEYHGLEPEEFAVLAMLREELSQGEVESDARTVELV